jgi:MoaA/NifB/PqqE/SkfB family radical SAM enzyme
LEGFKWSKFLRAIQFDLTSYCNAKCASCVRNIYGDKTRPGLPLNHFDIDLWKRLWSEDLRGYVLNEVHLNGNWGDAGMHPKLPELMRIASSHHPEVTLFMHTNGGTHNEAYWGDLAESLRWFKNHQVIFAIDGMEDTHSIYRRSTSLDKIKSNLKAFSSNKGNAAVKMTLFDHNMHQIEDVKELARSLGACYFDTRHSYTNEAYVKSDTEEYHVTAHKAQEVSNVSEILNPGPDSKLRDEQLYRFLLARQERETEMPKSKCPWYNIGRIQLDPWHNVWPCCHTSLFTYSPTDQFPKLSYEENWNSLNNNTLEEVLKHVWFYKHLKESMDTNPYGVCVDICDVQK